MIILKRSTISETIIVLFVILFLYTGVSKIMDYTIFKEQIGTSPILEPIAPYIAGSLPFLEFAVVILLIVPKWRLKGFYFSTSLMVLFTGYIIAMLTFSKNIPCSCGGIIELLSWKAHIIFNSSFIALGLAGLWIERKNKQRTINALNTVAGDSLINTK